ncbi:MAG: GNAT family N-acetyltransferase [Anaerolineae bacterium]|nr:GNAT family N-acetyltransferase [Anaerolineae bacterium]
MVLIRRANEQDIEDIIQVKQAVWPDEAADAALMRQVIWDAAHLTQVAIVDDGVVGFVDGFNTLSLKGVPQWNLDLIAVHPAFQGRGIASDLMRANTGAGRDTGAGQARGLVAVDNVASQRTFMRCGYVCDEVVCGLYVGGDFSGELGSLSNTELARNIIPVTTLNYRGLWVENAWTNPIFAMALGMAQAQSGQIIGAVIPLGERGAVDVAQVYHLELVGHYQWWMLDFTESAIV